MVLPNTAKHHSRVGSNGDNGVTHVTLNCFITGPFGVKGYQTSVPLCNPSGQWVSWLLKLTGVVCAMIYIYMC